ncbi:MAG: hypothetical protein VB074_07175 [Proteiniphilum sp.]|jgi:hypothetical protein|nr:hypothetical protein [Proteiniphilum sp.]MEA5127949.1 hypothetical protein [Proteiniphilum sp.]
MKNLEFVELNAQKLEEVNGGIITTNPFYGIQQWILGKMNDLFAK